MDQFENYIETEESDEPTTLDDYFGYGIKETLEEIEYNMEGLSLTIVMQSYDEEATHLKQVFEYQLADIEEEKQEDEEEEHQQIVKVKMEPKEEEDIKVQIKKEVETRPEEEQCHPDQDLLKLIERIELRKRDYENLLNKVTEKLKDLQRQYSEKAYRFSIIKKNNYSHADRLSDNSSDSDSELSFCKDDSITSSESFSKKRKNSMEEDSDSETDQRSKSQCSIEYPFSTDPSSETLTLGPNGTQIYRKEFEALRWKDAAGATRDLCNVIFGERILATHSLTGNQSPAFRGRERPIKAQLDSDKTGDITHFICCTFKVTQQLVRATITTKCADAAKKIKRMKLKKNSTM